MKRSGIDGILRRRRRNMKEKHSLIFIKLFTLRLDPARHVVAENYL
jgi:hypothetical protein